MVGRASQAGRTVVLAFEQDCWSVHYYYFCARECNQLPPIHLYPYYRQRETRVLHILNFFYTMKYLDRK